MSYVVGNSKEPSQLHRFSYVKTDGSDFIWDFRKLPLTSHLGKYCNKIRKISANIYEMAIFGWE